MAIDTQRLLRVGLAKAKDQSAWLEGISLEKTARQTIDELRRRVVIARLSLAKDMRAYSAFALGASKPMHRLVISRSYYCMYHAMRSVAYIYYGGDDHQQHSDLPQKIPNDFPDHAMWGNQLKSAREYRNQADYDPYPKSASYWKAIATSVSADANKLMPVVVTYLRDKGCSL